MEYLSKRDLCKLLKVSIGKVNKMMREGKLRYYKVGKIIRFRREEVDKNIFENYVMN